MKLNDKNGVKYFTFENIEETGFVNHAFSTRVGGTSTGFFESMNLIFSSGDKKEIVEENFKIFCNTCEMDYKKIVRGKQIHDNKVKIVTKDDVCGFERNLHGFDGYITNSSDVVLVTFHADCAPLFFVDVKNKAIGLAHSGWKGTAKKIGKSVVEAMADTFGSNPKDIVAAIGPSIGKCCFQVDKPVVEVFEKTMDFAEKYIYDDNEQGKYKLDLWEINREIMVESGILPENIEITNRCTMCEDEIFYSHRRMGGKRGSLAAFMGVKG